jgi:hypothetical protein
MKKVKQRETKQLFEYHIYKSLWKRIEHLVNDALLIKQHAESIIAKFENINNDTPLYIINADNLYNVVCGKYKTLTTDKNEYSDKIRLFWRCIRATVTDQFGGFSARDTESSDFICERAFLDKSMRNDFWKDPPIDNPARIWFLVAYLHLFREKIVDVNPNIINPIIKYIGDYFEMPASHSSSLENVRKDIAYKLVFREFVELGLHNIFKPKYGGKDDLNIFQRLERDLTRGNEPPAVEVSLIMRALGGRYINKIPNSEPWWKPTFAEGIKYVLQKQNENDGSWWNDLHFFKSASPLLHQYAPLLHIMDLDLDTLRPHLDMQLVLASERVLRSIKSKLGKAEEYVNLIRNDPFHHKLEESKVFMETLFCGLSVGTMVYDRFKDLLSDSILNSLHAEEVVRYDSAKIPDNLSFKINVEKGVIDLWITGNERRPGALLIFGPPGTGKTTVARNIAGWLNEMTPHKHPDARWKFLSLTPANFAHEGSNGIVSCAERLFEQLKKARRCVVLMDEMEEFLRTRDSSSDRESRLITTAFLPLLQEVISSREIILVVATNFVARMDPAVTRRGRFDLILPLGPPDATTRIHFIEQMEEFKAVKEWIGTIRSKNVIRIEEFKQLVAAYTMAYSVSELEDYFRNLVNDHLIMNNKYMLTCRPMLETLLWRIRAENVPNALSNRAGCNWRVFADETVRYARYSSNLKPIIDNRYWQEPILPVCSKRTMKGLKFPEETQKRAEDIKGITRESE